MRVLLLQATTAALAAAAVAVAATTITTTPTNLSAIFSQNASQWDAATVLVLPDAPTFANITERWTVFGAPTFAGAIRPATEADVVKTVQLARQHDIPFLATGGRHGFSTTLHALDQGLEIDLSQLDSVEIDDTNATVTIGAGVVVDDILDPIYDAGFEMREYFSLFFFSKSLSSLSPSAPRKIKTPKKIKKNTDKLQPIEQSTCSCPGQLGVTLGGGIGRFTGKYGLAIDALLSVRLVTADGRLLHVSNTSNPDLFWAIRGAGHNFGIVTSATYELRRVSDSPEDRGEVMLLDFILPPSMSLTYFELLESFMVNGSLPANMAQITSMGWDTTLNSVSIVSSYLPFCQPGLIVLALSTKPPSDNV